MSTPGGDPQLAAALYDARTRTITRDLAMLRQLVGGHDLLEVGAAPGVCCADSAFFFC